MRFGADFDALIARFSPESSEPIVLGVSGGSDSTAMLLLASTWAEVSKRKLIVLTVDHRLRPEAALEASSVANLSNTLGHTHKTLEWNDARNSQAAARQARHRLLANAARLAGASILLLGHTLDDVTETVLLRRRRGVRQADAAGPTMVSASPVWPEGRNLTIIRPLLLNSRKRLRDFLKSKKTDWIDDPSNDNSTYERIAIRKRLQKHPEWPDILVKITKNLLSERAFKDDALGSALLDAAKIKVEPNGLLHLNDANPSPALLSVLLRAAGGHDQAPRRSALNAMLQSFSALGERRTFAGTWLQKTKDGFIIGRDPGEARPKVDNGLWDGRYEASAEAGFDASDVPYLVRSTAPPHGNWREIISNRIAHEARCYQTPLLKPVQT